MNNNKKIYRANDYMCKVHKVNVMVVDIGRLEEMEEKAEKKRSNVT